jgi:hypothetical protein
MTVAAVTGWGGCCGARQRAGPGLRNRSAERSAELSQAARFTSGTSPLAASWIYRPLHHAVSAHDSREDLRPGNNPVAAHDRPGRFLLFEVTRTKYDLAVVANFDVPLTQSVSRLHEYGLRRRLAFERWFGALNAAQPNGEVVAEATSNYTIFTRKLADEIFLGPTVWSAPIPTPRSVKRWPR